MSELAIKANGLSKRYRIGLREEIPDTFVGAVIAFIRSPLKNLRQLRRLSRFEDGQEAEDVIWALKDVSFEVKKGEVIGIIGRNGAGKSTLLKILAGITFPTTGRVEMDGRVASLLEVGTGFHHELTGRENVYLNGTILGMTRKEIDRKFDEIVDFSGVEKFIDTPVKRYSSGMRVRLAFSVAAHLEAEILLIDEVLAVGDMEFQKKCLGKMDEVAKGGRTVLFVSHNMGAVQSLCTRGLVLNFGDIIYIGDIQNAILQYISDQESHSKIMNYATNNSKPTITRACLIDDVGNPTNSIKMGIPFGIQVEFSSPFTLRNPVLGIRINGVASATVMGVTSLMHSNKPLFSNVTEGIFTLIIRRPFLNQGTYSITLTLADNQATMDRIVDALHFEVTPNDVYSTGLLPSSSQSLTFFEGEWKTDKDISEIVDK